jgi:hypothetical protein
MKNNRGRILTGDIFDKTADDALKQRKPFVSVPSGFFVITRRCYGSNHYDREA